MSIIKPEEYAARRQRLLTTMGKGTIAILPSASEQLRNGDTYFPFHQQSDFYYLTGFNEPEALAVLMPGRPQGEYILFNRSADPTMELWQGRRAGQAGAVKNYGVDEAFPIHTFAEKLPELLAECSQVYFPIGRQLKLDQMLLTAVNTLRCKVRAGVTPPVSFVNIEHALYEMRLIKSSAEIAVMRKAAAISAAAHQRAMAKCQPGLWEHQLQAEMQHEFLSQGSKALAYDFIIGGGANACILHYSDNDAVLKDGELVLIDAGCEYENYASDITRTFPVNGRFTPEQRAIYEIVLEAQLATIALIRPGLRWNVIHETAVRKIIEGLIQVGLLQGEPDALIKAKAHEKFYMHATSHWLGLDVHDAGAYKKNGDWRVLEPGMVLTVEPGIYIAANTPDVDKKWWNIGVRIEDDILVTEKGCEILSKDAPKTSAEIEALVGKTADAK